MATICVKLCANGCVRIYMCENEYVYKGKLPDDPPHPIVPYEQWYKGERA